jgi:hypothetical protein
VTLMIDLIYDEEKRIAEINQFEYLLQNIWRLFRWDLNQKE